jgi:hypothetical protein
MGRISVKEKTADMKNSDIGTKIDKSFLLTKYTKS